VSLSSSVTLKLFASLAETHGWRERNLAFNDEMRVIDCWAAATGLETLPPRVLCARNMAYCDAGTLVAAGDEIAFFPPVTGGSHAG